MAQDVERTRMLIQASLNIQTGVRTLLEILGGEQDVETTLEARSFTCGQSLSPAELDVLAQLARGKSVGEVARARERSPKTVEHQIAGALRKLDFGDRREFIGYMKGVRGDPPATLTSDAGGQSQSMETTGRLRKNTERREERI